ncbi:MAG: hypothetical protein LBQ93_08535 [Treponema sp.]|jgi:uncharacterized DUF497 family protein|nr:hypothetical protein [Treponema sp.]
MYINVRYSKSALKHVTKEDIQRAMINVIYDDILDDNKDRHLLIGFDGNGNLLEILYNVIDDYTIRVFHAMKCTNEFIRLLNR